MITVLDLFAGLHGWSEAFEDRGHRVISVDNNDRFDSTITADILDLTSDELYKYASKFDIILASPPCQSYSVAGFRHHWKADSECERCGGLLTRVSGEKWEHTRGYCDSPKAGDLVYAPKSETGRLGQALLRKTLGLISEIDTDYYMMENPRGLMRKMPEVQDLNRVTITQCQYGLKRMKPTDIFGNFPDTWEPRPMCYNGAPCHERAPRGTVTGGTQSIRDVAIRSRLPYELGLDICIAMEAISD